MNQIGFVNADDSHMLILMGIDQNKNVREGVQRRRDARKKKNIRVSAPPREISCLLYWRSQISPTNSPSFCQKCLSCLPRGHVHHILSRRDYTKKERKGLVLAPCVLK
jgi:hypothetical protein